MKKKIILATLALSLSSFAFAETLTVEKVYAEDGSLDIPTYPILDKRTLSASRGGDRSDYDSTIDGMGVKIVGKKGEAVDTVYGQYNTLLRSSTRIKSINSMLADGEIQGSISALRTICENPDYGCTPGLNKNTVTQQCENNPYCADSQMEFDGTKCFSNGTKLVSALMTPSYSCTEGVLEGIQCRVNTTKTIPAVSSIEYSCEAGYTLSGDKCSKTVATTYAATSEPAGYTISAASTIEYYGTHGIQKSGNYFRMIINTPKVGGWVTMSADGRSIKPPGYSQAKANSSNPGHHIGNRSGGFGYAYYGAKNWTWSSWTTIDSSNNIGSNLLITNNGYYLGFQRYNKTHFRFRYMNIYGAAITWVPYGTAYSCPSGGTLSGSTCSTTTVSTIDATAKRIYTCSAGSLEGIKCRVPDSFLNQALMTPIYTCASGILETDRCRVPNNVEAPALCAAGTFSAEYAKCIAPLVRTCK